MANYSEEHIEESITKFLDKYFKEMEEVYSFEDAFLDKNEMYAPEKIDYFKLWRFVETAVRNLRSIDARIFEGLVLKLYKDSMSLLEFHKKTVSNLAMPGLVFERDFLGTLDVYAALLADIEKTKAFRDTYEMQMKNLEQAIKSIELRGQVEQKKEEYKGLQNKYADAVHYYAEARDRLPKLYDELDRITEAFREPFLDGFNAYKEHYIDGLKRVINTKLYYLDKLIWYKAEKSTDITRFFKESGIKGGYDTKTFIEYYLRNINVGITHDSGWHGYLKEILSILE